MKTEQEAFSERLRAALRQAGMSESPAELMRLLARFGGEPVSQQAISGWLNGRAMPRQGNMRALARMLSMEPQQLQFGDNGRKVRETRADYRINPHDQLAIDAFLKLPASQRKLVRSLIEELGRQHAPGKAAKKGR